LQAVVDPVGEGDLPCASCGLAAATRHSAPAGEDVQIQRPEEKSLGLRATQESKLVAGFCKEKKAKQPTSLGCMDPHEPSPAQTCSLYCCRFADGLRPRLCQGKFGLINNELAAAASAHIQHALHYTHTHTLPLLIR